MITPKIVPVLASGCTVIESSRRLTPLTTLAVAELAIQAGIPCGELNEVVGNAFERGGNALCIIFDDAYLDVAMNGTLKTKFKNSGKTCVCANRLVQEAIHRANDTNGEVVRKEKRIDGGGSTLNFSKHVWVGVNVAMLSRTILALLEGLKMGCIVRSEQMKQQGDKFNAFEPHKLSLVRNLIYGAIVGATYSFQLFTGQFPLQSQALQMGTSKFSWKIVELCDIQALYVGHNTISLQVLPSPGVLWNLATFEELKGNDDEENAVLILLALCNSRTTVAHENSIGCLCSLVKRDDDFKLQVDIEGGFVTLKDIWNTVLIVMILEVVVDKLEKANHVLGILSYGVLDVQIAAAKVLSCLAYNTKIRKEMGVTWLYQLLTTKLLLALGNEKLFRVVEHKKKVEARNVLENNTYNMPNTVKDAFMVIVAAKVLGRMLLDKLFSWPPSKTPFQFLHSSLGDKTHSRGEYCCEHTSVDPHDLKIGKMESHGHVL